MLIGAPQRKNPAAVSGAGRNSTHPISPLSQLKTGRKNDFHDRGANARISATAT
jgi:hypothetical protein